MADRQTAHEGDEAGRCGGCGSRELTTYRICVDSILIGKCQDCGRIQDVETRDWPEAEMCDDCAFRKGSPEQADPYKWADIMEIVKTGRPFHCHKGLPHDLKTGSYEMPDHEKGRVTVCAGWLNARVAHLKRIHLPDGRRVAEAITTSEGPLRLPPPEDR